MLYLSVFRLLPFSVAVKPQRDILCASRRIIWVTEYIGTGRGYFQRYVRSPVHVGTCRLHILNFLGLFSFLSIKFGFLALPPVVIIRHSDHEQHMLNAQVFYVQEKIPTLTMLLSQRRSREPQDPTLSQMFQVVQVSKRPSPHGPHLLVVPDIPGLRLGLHKT